MDMDDLVARAEATLERLKRERPAWFKGDIPYPHEDFSSPDLSGVEIDLSEVLRTDGS